MSIVFDIILIFILALAAFIGYKKGLVYSLSKFLSYILSFAFSNSLYIWLTKLVAELGFIKNMLMPGTSPFDIKMTFTDRVAESFAVIKENVSLVGDETAKAAANNAVAIILASAIGFIITFIVVMLILKLILRLLSSIISKIHVLRQIDGILGSAVGLLNGFFWTWAVTKLFRTFLLPLINEKFPNMLFAEFENSFIVQLFDKINPVTYIMQLINLIFH